MTILYFVQLGDTFARDNLPNLEKCFNGAGYLPIAHKYSGGSRIVGGFAQVVASIALAFFFSLHAEISGDSKFNKEAWKVLDYAVHGVANMVRGFVECHVWLHFACLFYDKYVPEKERLRYSRPIFEG
jgi:hypothetical protein